MRKGPAVSGYPDGCRPPGGGGMFRRQHYVQRNTRMRKTVAVRPISKGGVGKMICPHRPGQLFRGQWSSATAAGRWITTCRAPPFINWLKPAFRLWQPKIHGASAAQPTTGLRSLRMGTFRSPTTQQLIVDACRLVRIASRSRTCCATPTTRLIPGAFSAIDIHADGLFHQGPADRRFASRACSTSKWRWWRTGAQLWFSTCRWSASLATSGTPFPTTISDRIKPHCRRPARASVHSN